MIKFMTGNVFDVYCDIRVNTVNCVGVMGAGIAREFKDRYPVMFEDYIKLCRKKQIVAGCPVVWKGQLTEIINFPTKNHWRNPSEYEYIENGLVWLSEYLAGRSPLTIAIPPLGCGNGGLDWDKVRPMIVKHLDQLDHQILLFNPRKFIPSTEKRKPQMKGKAHWYS